MAKLYFRYGAVGSAKTLNLLAVAHSYRQQQKRVLLLKPELDIRFGATAIKSRAGLETDADMLLHEDTILDHERFAACHCVLVDEAQFLSTAVVEQLRDITLSLNIPVICYGLRTDFRGQLFSGSKRLMELADAIEEIKMTCHYCNRKATMNLKLVGGKATLAGPTIELGSEERYLPTCAHCYRQRLGADSAYSAVLAVRVCPKIT